MSVSEAVTSRRSVRAFLPKPIDPALLRDVIDTARWAPSGGNLQPWTLHVATGATLASLIDAVTQRAMANPTGESHEYEIYPRPLSTPYRDRRFGVGEGLYRTLGVEREDTMGRAKQFLENYRAFGAPCVIFAYIPRDHGAPQWSDMGMLLQTLMLVLRERGLDSCPQEAWSRYAATIDAILKPSPELMLFAGVSVGYADLEATVNQFQPDRAPLDEIAHFHD